MDELVTWLRAQLDEDEWWAREASRDPFGRSTPTGEHWRWEDEATDQPVTIDPVGGGEVLIGDNWAPVGLRSVERYRSQSDLYDLCHLVVRGQDELQHEVAGHIARWDPARVLAEVEAKRRLLDLLAPKLPEMTEAELHDHCMHPAYEYATTEGQRKAWYDSDVPPEGEGWERNRDRGRYGWERFDYTEESYWRRLRPDGPESPHIPMGLRLLALPYADRPGYREEWRP